MLKKIGAGLAIILLAIIGYAAVQPAEYRVSREITINAPAEKIFPYLNNARLAEKWGPWAEVDPTAKMNYSGPDQGVGARTYWESAKQLGTGSATIVQTVPNERVDIRLEYTQPMAMVQESEYVIKSAGGQGSTVSWTVRGKNALPNRIMCLFVNMDKMVGEFFEKGLSKLKNIVEGEK